MSCETESAYAEERRVQISTESVLRAVNFTGILADGETLSGTPTVTVSPSGSLTVTCATTSGDTRAVKCTLVAV